MTETEILRRRLLPLLLSFFAGGVALWAPVEKLFLAEIGFTPGTIGLVAACYAVVVPVLELPTGILADRWSRRGVLILGNVGAIASVAVGGAATNVRAYLVSACLLGVYFAMHSGTFDAIVYDTVVEETGSSDLFESMIGRVRAAESISLVLAALVGGGLAAITSARLTYFATLPFLVVSTLLLLRFREPSMHRRDGERSSLRQHATAMVATVKNDRRLQSIAALLVLCALTTQTIVEFGPLWLLDTHAGAAAFGPAWAAVVGALGLGGVIAPRIQLDRSGCVRAIVAVLAAAGAALVYVDALIAVVVAQAAVVAVVTALAIAVTRHLHDAVASEVRTGVASGVGLATWLTFLPFALGFGALADRWSVHIAAALLIGAIGAIAALLHAVARAARPGHRADIQVTAAVAAA